MKKCLIISQFIILSVIIMVFNPLTTRILSVITAKRIGLNINYFYKQIGAESSYRCFTRSHVQAIGAGQITRETARYIAPEIKSWRLWLPWDNLYVSALYTRHLLNKYKGNYSLALASYNWGETNVDNKLKYHNIHISRYINYRFLFKNIPETDSFLKEILE